MTDWHVPTPDEPAGIAKKWLVVTGVLSFIGGIAFTSIVGIGALFYLGSTGGGPVLSMTVGQGGDISDLPTTVGTCFNGNTNLSGSTIKSVEGEVACVTDHNLETFFSAENIDGLPGYYDKNDLSTFTDALCTLQFRQYVGLRYTDSSFSYASAMPSEQAWANGDRRITCVLNTRTLDKSAKGIRE